MIEVVRGADATVATWVAMQLGFTQGFGPCVALGVVRDGVLVGGVVFNNWDPQAGVIEMVAAATDPRWLTRTVLGEMFGYVFDIAKAQLVAWRVSERNHRTRRLAERLGFEGHPIPRLRGRDEAEIIFTLTEEHWRSSRYERADHGQEVRTDAA